MIPQGWLRRGLIWLPFLWLALFFLLPLLVVAGIGFAESADTIPPYAALITRTSAGLESQATLDNYRELARSCLLAYGNSLGLAAFAAALCLLIGYPIAFAISRAPGFWRQLLLFFVVLPFWTSFLLLNRLLLAAGLIDAPLPLLYNGFAVELGLVYSYLPFMILPLYGSLARLDESLVEAAADLGARPWRVFVQVILPLTVPGIAAGCLLVFIPAVGEFVIPDLLGGPSTVMVGKLLWQEFFDNVDWPVAAAMAVALVVVLTLPLLLAQRFVDPGNGPQGPSVRGEGEPA